MIDQYNTIEKIERFTQVIKKSKFIATIVPVKTEEEAKEELESLRKEFYNATHNCWAYRLFSESFPIERFSDDGEPSRSAGYPMMQTLQGRDFYNVLVVVTRFFGGTKLGVGGLIRAYGGSVQNAVENAKTIVMRKKSFFKVRFDHDNTGIVMREVKEKDLKIVGQSYDSKAEIVFYTDPELKDKVIEDFKEKSAAKVVPDFIEDQYINKKWN